MRALGAVVRRAPWVAGFLLIGTVLFAVVGLVRGEAFVWIYLPALIASVAVLVAVDARFGPIRVWMLWLLAVWAVLHLAGGLAPNPTGESDILYGMWLIDGVLRYDQVVHGFGIGAATAALVHAARGSSQPLLWGFVWAQALGVVNETVENVFAAFVEDSNVGDWVNTTWDLVWHLIGGLVAILWLRAAGFENRAVREAP